MITENERLVRVI